MGVGAAVGAGAATEVGKAVGAGAATEADTAAGADAATGADVAIGDHRPARNASTSSAVGIAEEQARREATMAPAALA